MHSSSRVLVQSRSRAHGCACVAAPCFAHQLRTQRRLCMQGRAQAFHINRRQHLDSAWVRQEQAEERMAALGKELEAAQTGSCGQSIEVENLQQLDALIEAAGSVVVVLFMYSKTCGVCKSTLARFQELAQDARRQKARVVFLQHNVLDEYDQPSDVARFHKVKAVPCFLFLDEGAVVERLNLRDIRRLSGSQEMIQGAITDDLRRLKRTFSRVLLRCAPSAR